MEGGGMEHGYWGPPTATIDWCEDNYVYSFYVAEFFNTISNASFTILALFALWECRREGHAKDLVVMYALVVLTGMGSALFHGTLQKWAQQLDETPMIIGIIQWNFTLWRKVLPRPESNWWFALIFVHDALFAIWHWQNEWIAAFQLYFGAWVLLAAARLWTLYHTEWRDLPFVRTLLHAYVGLWVVGVILWLTDQHFCSRIKELPVNPEGHAWWHVCMGLTCYVGPLAILYSDAAKRGLKPQVHWAGGVLPVVRNKIKQ